MNSPKLHQIMLKYATNLAIPNAKFDTIKVMNRLPIDIGTKASTENG
jgi:hypothetical protein